MNTAIREWIEANHQPWRGSPEESVYRGGLGSKRALPLDPETSNYFARRGIETDGRLAEDLIEADLLGVVEKVAGWLEPDARKRFDESVAFGFGSTLEPNACALECLDGYAILLDNSFHALLVHALELYYGRMAALRTIQREDFPLLLNSAISTVFFHGADPLAYVALKPKATTLQRAMSDKALWFACLFFVGHEAGHVLLNHFDEAPSRGASLRSHAGRKSAEVLQPAHAQEFEADEYAGRLLFVGEELGELTVEGADRTLGWSANYGVLGWIFSVLAAVERVADRIGVPMADTHPPASQRWERIAAFLRARVPIQDAIVQVDDQLREHAVAMAESGPMPEIQEKLLNASDGFIGLPWDLVQWVQASGDRPPEPLPSHAVWQAWIESPTPGAAMEVLLGFPEMMHPAVEALHYDRAKAEDDETRRRDILVNKLLILRRSKQIGIVEAFEEYEAKKLGVRTTPLPSYAEAQSSDIAVLAKVQEALEKFTNADTTDETELVFESHPQLQHAAADFLLAEVAKEQTDESARKRVEAARIILAYAKKFTVFRAVMEARARLRY